LVELSRFESREGEGGRLRDEDVIEHALLALERPEGAALDQAR
jgi:hypothetical protein